MSCRRPSDESAGRDHAPPAHIRIAVGTTAVRAPPRNASRRREERSGRKRARGQTVRREAAAAVPYHPSKEAALAPRGGARTFLTHFVGGGLEDERYVVETFRSLANGDIVPVAADGAKTKGRRKARDTILPLKAIENIRPARDEIIIATGVELPNCGVQFWGWRSLGILPTAARRADFAPLRTSRRPAAGLLSRAARCAVDASKRAASPIASATAGLRRRIPLWRGRRRRE